MINFIPIYENLIKLCTDEIEANGTRSDVYESYLKGRRNAYQKAVTLLKAGYTKKMLIEEIEFRIKMPDSAITKADKAYSNGLKEAYESILISLKNYE